MSRYIQRYTEGERRNHWIVAISFVLAALSGLAVFHPSMFWLSNFFGGGPWTRILHPYIGVVMFVFFLITMVRFWRHNKLSANDRKWLAQWRDAMGKRDDRLPESGRYNAGQKVVFWVSVICMIILLATGIVFWRAQFGDLFPVELIRLASLLHAIAATVLIITIIVHIYAAIWVKGSIRAMIRGDVSEAWAKKHHAAWHREMTR
jgi:formate dehydrogenase subunit gamma